MANWCNNIVAFDGEETALEQLKGIFRQIAIREGEKNCGQLPEFLKAENGGYFFNIVWEEGDCIISYDTRWAPNTDTLTKIAERYGLDFVHDYEEMGNLLFGRAVYEDGNLREINLEDKDFSEYSYSEQSDTYLFEGAEYECETEILETLLDRKANNLNQTILQ